MSASIAAELTNERPATGILGLAERGLLPDEVIRFGIRRLCAQRLRDERAGGVEQMSTRLSACIDTLRLSPIAIHTEDANRQHYELPAAFFQYCLGPRLKYSSCYYPNGDEILAEAEEAMLSLYGIRAELADGQDILELGCGWGSLTLWMAERYPNSRITAVSNSAPQRMHIEAQCLERGLRNVRVITCDVNEIQLPQAAYDRCVSIEMFEHMRNYGVLMSKIARALKPSGSLFVHIFCHRTLLYPYETRGEDNWMGRHFFTGGLMPAADTLLHFQDELTLTERWLLDGTHYARTANHWLQRQDEQYASVLAVLHTVYGDAARLWHQRWRMFWMSCAELFAYNDGQEWMVAHYRFKKGA